VTWRGQKVGTVTPLHSAARLIQVINRGNSSEGGGREAIDLDSTGITEGVELSKRNGGKDETFLS